MSEPAVRDHCGRCGHPLDAELDGVCPVCALDDVSTAPASPDEAIGAAQLMLDDLPLEGATHARVGNYELREPLGAGGMGVVYKAWQTDLERWVAIKLLPMGHFGVPAARERFRREALTLAKLQHPNIVSIHDFGEREGQPYLVMEYVEGASLEGRAGAWLATPEKAAGYIKAAAEGMQAAHEAGVLHRDLKPSNLLLGRDDRIRITDFGLARSIAGRSTLTGTGVVLGTLAYVAPEQLSGGSGAASVRSDVYSLGAVLYQLLTGRAPFVAASPAALVQEVVRAEAPSPRLLNPLVPRDLALICAKCLRKDPRDRYASAGELAEDLARFLAHREIQARPLSRFKRARGWARLNPAGATTLALGVALVTTLGVVGAVSLRDQIAVVRARIAAGQQATERERLRAYAQQLDEARRAFEAHNHTQAEKLLAATPPDLRGWEYGFLERAQTGGPRSWLAHRQAVSCLAVNLPGTRIVSGDWGGTLRFWEAASGQLLQDVRPHQGRITSVRYSADGQRLVTSSADGTACVLAGETGTIIRRFEAGVTLNQATFLGDGGDVLTVSDQGRLERWRVGTREPPTPMLVQPQRLLTVDVNLRSGAYACGDDLGRIQVGPLDGKTPPEQTAAPAVGKRTWQAHQGLVLCVASSPDGAVLASGGGDG